MKDIERMAIVFCIQGFNRLGDLPNQCAVFGSVLFICISKISQQRKPKIRIAVAQVMQFQLLNQILKPIIWRKQRWNDDHGSTFARHTLVKIHARQCARFD